MLTVSRQSWKRQRLTATSIRQPLQARDERQVLDVDVKTVTTQIMTSQDTYVCLAHQHNTERGQGRAHPSGRQS
jgi:hypothetical protein